MWEEEEKRPFLRKLLARSWYIFIPLIGVWWFHVRELTPRVEAIERQIQEERQETEAERTDLLKGSRKMGVTISRLGAFTDTIEVRKAQIQGLLDSVNVIRRDNIEETQELEAQVDSLRQVLSEAEGQSMEYSTALQSLQQRVDSLRTQITAHREETARLEEQIEETRALTDRIANPDKYRDNDALMTGEGDFPNRDALPKR
ncbi:MAG: hypothetical protein GF346_07390 [Candidatus Eisenbacteria bacterium]|nr:hypothetical protein [Candidatus Latescibacterota bacterium]MBD3302255.1 hypothetical protein [Candidatus Eisenbacteria bacterium]